jgi:hypothetical protein
MTDQYASWRAALDGKKLDMGAKGEPPSGYFRRNAGNKGWELFAVWRSNGVLCCERNMFGDGASMDADQIDQLFASEVYTAVVHEGAPLPIEHTARLSLKEIKAGAGMTAEVGRAKTATASILEKNERAVIGDNSQNAAPHELLGGRINDLLDERKAWLAEIGGSIATQEHADRAAAFAEAFAKLEKDGVETHKTEKEPHLKAGREVDATWKPIISKADDGKRSTKALLTPYLRKQADEAAEAQRKAAAEAAQRQQPAPVQAVAPRAVNGGRGVSLRTVRSAVVNDLLAVAAYLAGMANPDRDFAEVCRKAADKLLKAGVLVPGAAIVETQEAA